MKQSSAEDFAEIDDSGWRNPDLSLTEKFNRHIVQKRKSGVLKSASKLNKFIPWAFFFVYLGGSGWIVLGAAPYHYQGDVIRFFLVEVFTLYVFVQVFINWLFICFTTSPYLPDDTKNDPTSSSRIAASDKDSIGPESRREEETEKSSLSCTPSATTNYRDESNTPGQETIPNNDNSDVRTGLTYRVMVVTGISAGSKPQRQSMPYWSWVPCYICQRPRPPRCHHCTLCNQCVLKRDHHCYFTRNCIGVKNQRYFIYFLIWCVVLCSIGCFQLVPFIFQVVFPKYSYADLIFPLNVYSIVTGQLPFLYGHLITVTWGVVALTFISYGMCVSAVYHVVKGLTYFEYSSSIKIVDTRSVPERLRAVMGHNWVVGLVVPGAASFSFMAPLIPSSFAPSGPLEDAVEWPFIKP